MLYHVPDMNKALGEVVRVLRPGGHFYAVTNGQNHMRELKEMQRDALNYIGLDDAEFPSFALPFYLENGGALLQNFFEDVRLIHYEDSLLVTEVQPLVDYAFSSTEAQALLTVDRLARIRQFVADRMTASGGGLYITKAVGMFVGVKALC
jgi:SAM-dependent methyltransferase